jgi:cytoskeletal protein CcmA (bactofilin family)
MSIFSKRREAVEENPRPAQAPTAMTAQHNQPQPTVAAPSAPRPTPTAGPGPTSIGRTVTIKGEIRSDEDLLVDGQVEGRLDLGRNRLVVGASGQVRATIGAREVDVHGTVNGNVEATERIILRKDSNLVGDMKMASIVIEDGAYFKGSIDITRPQDTSAAAPGAAPKAPSHSSAG